jgi:hypothetical protein
MASASNRSRRSFQIGQTVVVGPLGSPLSADERVQEIRRRPGLERGVGLVEHLVHRGLNEFDVLAGLLLERGDDLPDRLVFLLVEAFVPPDDQIGGLRTARRHHERHAQNNGSTAHCHLPDRPRRQYLLGAGAWQRSRQLRSGGRAGQGIGESPLWVRKRKSARPAIGA